MKRRRELVPMAILGLVMAAVGITHAQLLYPDPGSRPSFEVATVKLGQAGMTFDFRFQPNRFLADNAPLDRLIRFAYDVKSDSQVANMPKWAGSRNFTVDAKIGDDESEAMKDLPPDQRFEQYRLMVQSLLANRFQLKVRTETRDLPIFALVIANNGSRLTASPALPGAQKLPLPQLRFTAAGDLKAAYVSMAFFTGWLSGRRDIGGRVVMDQTGLKGLYDFALHWSPVDGVASTGEADPNQIVGEVAAGGDKPSLFTAIQEQLGLRLEPSHGPIQVLVIDHVEQPTEN